MKNIRIIPRLDIKGPNLVKGIHMEGLRALGNPEDYAMEYYIDGADELIYQDSVASLYQRNSLVEIISKTAKNIFIPLTVGGGIRTIDDIKNVLKAGADKVSINTAAIKNPDFINAACESFGSSTIVVAIEAIKQSDNCYLAYTDNGREYTGIEVEKWAKQAEERGAGELLLTSIDREGTGEGYDLDLIKMITNSVNIPVIAHGGAGFDFHISNSINSCQVDAVAMSSILHYSKLKKFKKGSSNRNIEGNYEFFEKGKNSKRFQDTNIRKLKDFLLKNNISVRD